MSKQSTSGNLSAGAGFLPTEGPALVPAVDKRFFRSCRVLSDKKPVKAQEKSSCSTENWTIVL